MGGWGAGGIKAVVAVTSRILDGSVTHDYICKGQDAWLVAEGVIFAMDKQF